MIELSKTNLTKVLHNLIHVVNFPIALLNSDREILFSNGSFLGNFGKKSVEEILGLLPGNAINCSHINKFSSKSCGQEGACNVCGILQAFTESKKSLQPVVMETKSLLLIDNELVAYEFRVTVAPLEINKNFYFILFLEDISDAKHKRRMERIFFHDVLNKISALNGLFQLLQNECSLNNQVKDYFNLMGLLVKDISDEIMFQRQISAVERGELIVKYDLVNVDELINTIINQIKVLSNTVNVTIQYESSNVQQVYTDALLINRCITNLLKNSIEASNNGDIINVSTNKSDKTIVIAIYNKAYIPLENRSQIFYRSFSTKGELRGLGTYSVKILTERYLNGKTYFTSTVENGTTFYIEIPIQ